MTVREGTDTKPGDRPHWGHGSRESLPSLAIQIQETERGGHPQSWQPSHLPSSVFSHAGPRQGHVMASGNWRWAGL